MRRRTLLCVASFIALVLLTSGTASAQDVAAAARANRAKKEAAKGNSAGDSEWYKLTHASLRTQGEDALSTFYEINDNGDTRIKVDFTEKGKRETGEVMLVNGRSQWMLTRNVPLEGGYEIDVLDGPVLELKLALEFLRAAAPDGPSHVKEKTTPEVREDSRSIAVNTTSASGGIDAPWTLRATIEPIGADQWSFDLSVKHPDGTIHMSGTWQKKDTPPAFADDMPLDGWQILSIGPIKRTEGNATIYDYGAQISNKRAKTLGELRKM